MLKQTSLWQASNGARIGSAWGFASLLNDMRTLRDRLCFEQ